MYDVVLSQNALKVYAKADRPLARKIARCLEQLAVDPRGANMAKALTGDLAGKWRYRIGDWRVIYEIHDNQLLVDVIDIGPRGSIY